MFDKVLALDLATTTGWACVANNVITSGSINFKPSRFDSVGMKFHKFRKWLSEKLIEDKPQIVVFEEIHRHLSTASAHSFGGFLAILQECCVEKEIEYKGFGVGTIKKTGTGSGAAKKWQMIATAKEKFPDQQIVDDNQADALWLLETARKLL